MTNETYLKFEGKIVIVGFGSVAQGLLPLLLRHIDMPKDRISIITGHEGGRAEAEALDVAYEVNPVTRENFRTVLGERLSRGDFLINLSVDVSSAALMEFCCEQGVLYMDSCIEPWPGGYTDPSLSPSQRSNYAHRETVLALRRRHPKGPTAIPTHGANPGLISHWVKQGLVDLARDILGRTEIPQSKSEWAQLAMELEVKSIHCSERDTQVATPRKRHGEFVNTWSVDGFIGEGSQPCELGWGSHEKHFPPDGHHHEIGDNAAIYLDRPGASVRVRTWTPTEGHFHGFLITHAEAISIADYLTVREGDKVVLDFAGTDPQSAASINFFLNENMFKMFFGIYMIMVFDPQILFNDGFYDLVDVRIPEGSLLKPKYPAALAGRTHALGRIFDILGGLLGQRQPEFLNGAGFSSSPHLMYSGFDKSGEWFQLFQRLILQGFIKRMAGIFRVLGTVFAGHVRGNLSC